MKALATGIAGFIGSRIAQQLLLDGHEVRGFDNFLTGFNENVPHGAEFIEGDLRDLAAVRAAFHDVEVVFHQAARRSVAKSVDDPILTNECNVLGTLRTLMAAHEAGVRRVVYASSSSIYGDPVEPLRIETQLPQPISPYAVSKLAGEQYCRVWGEVHGLSTMSLRYFNVFGPGQHRESKYALVFPAFVQALVRGEAPVIDWDGEQARDFTYIDDIVEANLLAAQAGPATDGHVFNIGGGKSRTVNEVLKAVADVVGVWIEPTYEPRRAGDVRHTLADIQSAQQRLGWPPRAHWDESVRACVEWFRNSFATASPIIQR